MVISQQLPFNYSDLTKAVDASNAPTQTVPSSMFVQATKSNGNKARIISRAPRTSGDILTVARHNTSPKIFATGESQPVAKTANAVAEGIGSHPKRTARDARKRSPHDDGLDCAHRQQTELSPNRPSAVIDFR
jgi:hypothetical protein